MRAQVGVVARESAWESETRPMQRALEAPLLLPSESPTGGAVKMPWQQLWELPESATYTKAGSRRQEGRTVSGLVRAGLDGPAGGILHRQ